MICKLNVIPIKIPIGFLTEIEILSLQFIRKFKIPRMEKKKKILKRVKLEYSLPDFKTFYIVIIRL